LGRERGRAATWFSYAAGHGQDLRRH
jgi:hypothetical protein